MKPYLQFQGSVRFGKVNVGPSSDLQGGIMLVKAKGEAIFVLYSLRGWAPAPLPLTIPRAVM